MVGALYYSTLLAAASFTGPSSNTIIAVIAVVGGIAAWRSKRGDFYKAVAEEKTTENERLRDDNAKLQHATDITPIIDTLGEVTKALERHADVTAQVLEKVGDMNGSLRAHGEAMKALADHLILDEAARALLSAATSEKPRQPSRSRRTP